MIIEFVYNEPQTLALEHSESYIFSDRYNNPRVRFNLVGGDVLFVDAPTAALIRGLQLSGGETFLLVKRRDGRRNIWRAWLSPETEKARAAAEAPAIARELKAASTLGAASLRLVPPAGTGTYGPAPKPLQIGAAVPQKIPFNVAFNEAVRLVQEGLGAAADQWNDEARQAAVATILIAASKAGWLTLWERPAA